MKGRHVSGRARARRRHRQLLVVAVAVGLVAVATGARIAGSRIGHVFGNGHRALSTRTSSPGSVGTTSTSVWAPTTSTTTGTTAPSAPSTPSTTDPARASAGDRGRVLATPAIRQYLSSRSGDITAALLDLRTGRLSTWRPGTTDYTASIVKVDILATLLHRDQAYCGALPGVEQEQATSMIEDSDDDAATDLWDDIGEGAGVNAFNALVPLKDTTPAANGAWGLTEVSAADEVRLLRAIVRPSSVLDAACRRYELSLMEHVTSSQAWGVSAGVPAGVTVALKNGWLPLPESGWHVNSMGWISGDGRDYLLAVLTGGDPSEDYGIDTIEGLSRLVWTELSAGRRSPANRRPAGTGPDPGA